MEMEVETTEIVEKVCGRKRDFEEIEDESDVDDRDLERNTKGSHDITPDDEICDCFEPEYDENGNEIDISYIMRGLSIRNLGGNIIEGSSEKEGNDQEVDKEEFIPKFDRTEESGSPTSVTQSFEFNCLIKPNATTPTPRPANFMEV